MPRPRRVDHPYPGTTRIGSTGTEQAIRQLSSSESHESRQGSQCFCGFFTKRHEIEIIQITNTSSASIERGIYVKT
jgi:hypothetical protein